MKTIVASILCVFMFGCAVTQQSVDLCENHQDDSLICHYIKDPLQADLVLRLANVEAIKSSLYSKEKAIAVIDRLEDLANNTTTYADLIAESMKYVEKMGPEVFIITTSMAQLNQQLPIYPYDRELIIKHLVRQRQIIEMI